MIMRLKVLNRLSAHILREVKSSSIVLVRKRHFSIFFFVICLFFLQQHNTVLRIHYVQPLNLQKALQYLQYITYSNLLTIHITVLTIYYLQ